MYAGDFIFIVCYFQLDITFSLSTHTKQNTKNLNTVERWSLGVHLQRIHMHTQVIIELLFRLGMAINKSLLHCECC